MTRKDADRSDRQTLTRPRRRWMLLLAATLVVVASLVARGIIGDSTAEAKPADVSTQSGASHQVAPVDPNLPTGGPNHDVMAIVNGQDISRKTLAQACVERYGEDVLESLVNKRLIENHCRNRGVTITDQDIDAEIDRMAQRFKLGREQWLELLEKQRGVSPGEYKRDILWPTIALRKLANDDLVVSDAELQKAYESRYGASVRTRLIVVTDKSKAEKIHREVTARPDDFPRLAMQHSQDINSASIGGLIQPIRPHTGEPQIERAAFALQPGQISSVLNVGNQFVILKCEGRVPARNIKLGEVRGDLEEAIREEKLRGVANKLFAELQQGAVVKNVYNDPDLRARMPGVVATVNGDAVTMKELGQECLTRHGEEVLEVEISQMLLRQALQRANLQVSQQDIQAEMQHAARLAGVVDENDNPDLARWVKAATQEQGIAEEIYYRDSVWPSAALKKLTGGRVQVTQEDLEKGFQANYGERVRCRAIVLSDLRRAQEVWDKARQKDSMDYFGELAEQYSIEPTSRSLRGEVPPIRRNGGQPQLENAAFALAPGELSGITQVTDKFLILKCEGYTKPLDIELEEVRKILTQDIFEKKLRVAMGQEFDRIRSEARIDNYLAGTTQAPASRTQQAKHRRDAAVRPTGATQ